MKIELKGENGLTYILIHVSFRLYTYILFYDSALLFMNIIKEYYLFLYYLFWFNLISDIFES